MSKLSGAVSFQSGGEALKLQFDIAALCDLEEAVDLSVQEIALKLGRGMRLGMLRQIFLAGLKAHQPQASLEDADRMIMDLKIDEISRLIAEAFLAAFPVAEAAEGVGGQAAAE